MLASWLRKRSGWAPGKPPPTGLRRVQAIGCRICGSPDCCTCSDADGAEIDIDKNDMENNTVSTHANFENWFCSYSFIGFTWSKRWRTCAVPDAQGGDRLFYDVCPACGPSTGVVSIHSLSICSAEIIRAALHTYLCHLPTLFAYVKMTDAEQGNTPKMVISLSLTSIP